MDFILNFLGSDFFTTISSTIVGYLNQGVDFFEQQDILIQGAVLLGGVVIIFLGTIDLVKKLSKLIFVAVVLFALWFVYTNYVA
jgi:hypothetical protein